MFTINVAQECGCFKRSDMTNNQSFDSKDDALIEAQSMASQMNETFCQKHEFTLREDGENFTISMDTRAKRSGCCGGGHCS
ncbi:MAG TPA: hypothetical protein ENK86_00715 [Campylobacterales bacterium]|nr:hypothetical protein [Campylobacterales bacterium]